MRSARASSSPRPSSSTVSSAATRELAGSLERRLEGARRVSVVDEHGERLALVDGVEASRNALDRLDASFDHGLVDAERASGGGSREGILDVESSLGLHAESAEVVRRVEGDRVGYLGRQPGAVLVADVDDRTLRLRKQSALRVEVLVHRAVEVEVVLREVGEDQHDEARPIEPPLHG